VGWGAGGNDVPHGTVLRRQRQMAQGAPAAVAGPLGVLPTMETAVRVPLFLCCAPSPTANSPGLLCWRQWAHTCCKRFVGVAGGGRGGVASGV
jgi:hypothetical protein